MAKTKERTDAARMVLLGKLLNQQRLLLGQMCALDTEIQAVLKGDPTIGDRLKELQAAFSHAWEQRYRTPYQFQFAKDVPHMKRLLTTFGVEALKPRILAYISNNDPFFTRSRHTWGIFVSTINQHAPAGSEDFSLEGTVERLPGCKHDPPCTKAVACTERRRQERHVRPDQA